MMNRNGEAAMEMVNVTLSVKRMLEQALEKNDRARDLDAKMAYQLGYCEGTLREFIYKVMMDLGEERTVELMERAGINPVYQG
jgi:hypothetical protein